MFVQMHQQTDMDEGHLKKRKESPNGSICHSGDNQTTDKKPEKATVLQKDVSMSVCVSEKEAL